MPSPMALPSPQSRSSFLGMKKSSSPAPSFDAASYLNAVKEADTRARKRSSSPAPSSTATPALSMSSSVSRDTQETVLAEPCAGEVPGWDGAADDDALGLPRVPPTSEMEVFSHRHTEFGHCWTETYRHTSAHRKGQPIKGHVEIDPPYYILLSTYLSYIILICIGHVRDFVGKRARPHAYKDLKPSNVSPLAVGFL
jgi:serine palmitoyltransferase